MKFYNIKLILACVSLCLVLKSCTTNNNNTVEKKIDEEMARNQILALHKDQRNYHFEKKVDEFVALLSPDHLSVNRGEISSLSAEEHKTRFSNYFNNVEFEQWDDLNPPIIKFSDDYSLAYTIVDKAVVVNYKDKDGETFRDSTKFSWVAIYKRYDDKWLIDCVASTNKPSEEI